MTTIRTIALFVATAFAVQMASAQTPPPPEEIKTKVQSCQSCHGADGNPVDPQYPRLAGQYTDYLAKALHEYQSGERKNAIMGGFAATLSEDDIAKLSAYYASLPGKLDDLAHYEQGD